MVSKAVVRKIMDNNLAEIEVMRQSACGDSCASCSGCNKPNYTAKAVAKNPKNAQVGDVVNVRGSAGFVLKGASFVYILPLILFFIFYLATNAITQVEGVSIALGVVGFALGIYFAGCYSKKLAKKNEINLEIF